MEMRKRIALCAVCLSLLFLLCGCWNYRGLNELAIVSGIAIDRNPENGNYKLSFEIVDLKEVQQSGPKAKFVEAEGKTLFDAARNAKMRMERKAYFGNAQIIVISSEIAKSGQIGMIIDWFIRDAELRETTNLIVSQEETASAILKIQGVNNSIVSYEIYDIVSEDNAATSSTTGIKLYQVFNTLRAKGLSLTLPAIHNTINDEKPATEINGIAVFGGGSMLGYLTPEESKYFLFVMDEVKGGILSISSTEEEKEDTSLEISENKTSMSFSTEGGKLKVTVSSKTKVFLAEIGKPFDSLDEGSIESLEHIAGVMVKKKIEEVIRKVQTEYGSDIFGFGNMIYKKDFRLWNKLAASWDSIFPTLEVDVEAEVKIVNTAYIKKT